MIVEFVARRADGKNNVGHCPLPESSSAELLAKRINAVMATALADGAVVTRFEIKGVQ